MWNSRNIKTDIGQIPNCFLFDLNDLEQLYSSWIQNNITNEDGNNELFDIELKTSLDSFFRKLKFNLEQKMIFENKVNSLVKKKGQRNQIYLKEIFEIILKLWKLKKFKIFWKHIQKLK